jgi:TRAP-type mannitol/chloroaromatic compound transport system permease large subunit
VVAAVVYVAKNMPAVHTWWKAKLVTRSPGRNHRGVHVRRRGAGFRCRQLNKVTRLGLLSRMAERVTFVLIPPLLLIFLVLGTIFLGVATPTEGGAMGALGAIIMAMARGRLSFSCSSRRSTPPPSCRALWCSSWWAPPCSA